MSTIGAAKVMTRTGPVWCHYSKDSATIKLRRFSEGAIFELEVTADDIEEFVPKAECKKHVESPDGSYSLDSPHGIRVWTEILQKLEATVPLPVEALKKSKTKLATKPPVIVPITHLRQFYETIQLLETATWVNLAEFYSNAPDSLERLWNHSRKAFFNYKNDDDWGRGKTKTLPAAPNNIKHITRTNEFTAFISPPDYRLRDGESSYSFVERELNPRRTRGGVFPDKRPARKSGAGGIDVLLKSHVTGFPVVGEVKVEDDKNAFFALIQAMTYAVELSTPNQLARLKTHFANQFGDLNEKRSKVEIALLMVNHFPDDSRQPVLKLIKTLNKNLSQNRGCEGVHKFIYIENDGEIWKFHS